jgi:23S rRNA (uracil1939-C5)-methyltransferase
VEGPVTVTVRGVAAGGAGVADLPDGRVVFVPRTAPGDRATIRVVKSRPRWAEGSLLRLLEAGPERRDALCALYATCGGCQLQHVPYPRQLEWKGRIVADALGRIGGLGDVLPPEVVASPLETGYRSRVTFTLRRVAGGRVVAGFYALGRPAHVIDVSGECVLPLPELVAVWKGLRTHWGPGARLLPEAGRLRLTLRAGGVGAKEARGGVTLVVEGGARGWRAGPLAEAVPALAEIWHVPAVERTRGEAFQEGHFGGGVPLLAHGPAPGARVPTFTQVNTEAAGLLVDHVVGVAGSSPVGVAVDAYCGVGEFGRALVARGWRVTGIELDAAACAAARAGSPEGLDVLEGRVEERLEGVLPAELVIVNPPRAGLGGEVVEALARGRPPRLIYVSCDPATLARDVRALADVYALDSTRCFDLFPQTAHVETVLVMRVRGA